MKNLLISLSLFAVLLICGLFVFRQTTDAQNNLTASLLDLPAPPPPNRLMETVEGKRAENFYDKTNPPADDASIEELLDYWKSQNGSFRELGYNVKPSERTVERILAEVEKNPETVTDFLNVLPDKSEVADTVKRIYDSQISNRDLEEDGNYRVVEMKKWLTYNSNYFSDELFKLAQKSSETDEYVTNQEEVLALARVDWDRAQPLLERMLGNDKQPVSQTLARWAFYRRALSKDDSSAVEKYRDQLKATVENKNASAGMRDLAIDALVKEKGWQERDDWYLSLLGDKTLHDLKINGRSYTGLTTPMYYAPPGKYSPMMIELLKSDNPAVRSAVVRNLTTMLDENNPEIIRALLPLLENPEWAKDTGSAMDMDGGARRKLIAALGNFTMPESVPGLIAVLNEKVVTQSPEPGMTNMSNGAMSNTMPSYNYNVSGSARGVVREFYPYRSGAIAALAKQKDVRAISPLRLVLPEVESYERTLVVGALLASGGFSVSEQIEALELMANAARQNSEKATAAGSMSNSGAVVVPSRAADLPDAVSEMSMSANTAVVVNSMPYENSRRPYNPSELKFILGSQLATATEVGDELVAPLVARINYLDAKDAPLASALRKIMLNWRGAAINSLLLRDLKNGRAETAAVVKLLSLRKELREKQSNDVFDIRGGNAAALGISACLLEDAGEYNALIESDNAEAKTVMLACARLIRAPLPVAKVAEYLQNPNAVLALAAERYLESEDSVEARRIILAKHPGEAKILGATTFFAARDKSANSDENFLTELFASVTDSANLSPYYYLYDGSDELKITEKRLQKEVRDGEELIGVYAYDGNFIRIYKDKADYSWEEDPARYRERVLSEAEFSRFQNQLAANRADELTPFLSFCEEGCRSKELLTLNRAGGRRVFFKGDEPPAFFKELDALFGELRKPPAHLHYHLEKIIPGLEILFADERLQAQAVWKNGDDFRLLIDDTERARQVEKELRKQFRADEEKIAEEPSDYAKINEERRRRAERREFENFAWRKIEKNNLAGTTAQPAQIEFIPARDQFPVQATNRRWKARTANIEIRTNEEGLYKINRGRISQIGTGVYSNPLVTPGGAWAVAGKYFPEEGSGLVRVNLATNREYKVKLEGYPNYEAIAFVTSINKVLIFASAYEREGEYEEIAGKKGDYFLLDAQTGAVQPVKSEIRPLAQQTFRPLQPTAANPDELWATIPDEEKNETQIGIYNQKTFAFKSLLTVPHIEFDSMDLWADEPENKIYFVYAGHLLGLPLPKAAR